MWYSMIKKTYNLVFKLFAFHIQTFYYTYLDEAFYSFPSFDFFRLFQLSESARTLVNKTESEGYPFKILFWCTL